MAPVIAVYDIAGLFDAGRDLVVTAARTQRLVLKNPPVTVATLLETLRRAGLIQTATRLEAVADRL